MDSVNPLNKSDTKKYSKNKVDRNVTRGLKTENFWPRKYQVINKI